MSSETHYHLRRDLGPLLLLNAGIALLLTLLGNTMAFWQNLLIANCIGACCWLGHELLYWRVPALRSWPLRMLLVVPLAVPAGFLLAAWLGGPDVLAAEPSPQLWRNLLSTVLVTLGACAFFTVLYSAQAARSALEVARRRNAEWQQAETAARLALLQAQIEPHFLFNTLATVRSLIGRDTALAQQTLDLLNDYLRASLGRTRRAEVSLGDELALVSPLLQIARLRLGTRLRYEIVVPDELLALPLPPLLLQPLVENALEHGIEPALDGGSLRIVARRDGARLYLRVEDSGRGLQADAGEGLGLANVRQRLEALYGAAAQLALYPQQPHGVVAELCLPLAEAPSC